MWESSEMPSGGDTSDECWRTWRVTRLAVLGIVRLRHLLSGEEKNQPACIYIVVIIPGQPCKVNVLLFPGAL